MIETDLIRIVGAGPTGALLAILLRRQFGGVELFEARPDFRSGPAESGRSINLALSDRGIHALQVAGVYEGLKSALLPMRGRLIHHPNRDTSFQPYGQRPGEVNFSVSRHRLNQSLLEAAGNTPGIKLHFGHRFERADFSSGNATMRDLRQDRAFEVPMRPLIAADGAGSLVRRAMRTQGLIQAEERDLEHGYKELAIPADARLSLAADVLHIWPRGGFMLIALPNEDGSFTATLFLPKQGTSSFATLNTAPLIDRFLTEQFPDARELMPDCIAEFQTHPVGFLGTVTASPWQALGMTTLIGDAAHAMVPFHGQGMNCCFEDCVEFLSCIARHSSWAAALSEFGAARKPDTDAISAMALENYAEMRESVADPRFQLQQSLSLELERRFPERFIPRYAMVTFHHEIPYRIALARGAIQADILRELTASAQSLAQIDFGQAQRQIFARLAPINEARCDPT